MVTIHPPPPPSPKDSAVRFEHLALNVAQPVEMAQWYVSHCQMHVVRAFPDAPYTHFLADRAGQVCLELYANPKAPCLDLAASAPLSLHIALQVADAAAERDRLLAAGCRLEETVRIPDGSLLVMLRDPFGLCLQLCQRADPYPLP